MIDRRRDPSGVNAPSLKFAVVQEPAFAAQRMKNYLIRFLCKVWPAIPTKLRTHRCSLLSRLGKIRSKRPIYEKDPCSYRWQRLWRSLRGTRVRETALRRHRSHANQRRKLLPVHPDAPRSGSERLGFNAHCQSDPKMLRHVRFFEGEVQSVDLVNRCVVLAHG